MTEIFDDAPVRTASASDEVPVYLAAGAEQVFGILTRPVGPFNGTAVLFLHAGAMNMSSHKGGTWTRLARKIAADGFLALRIDYHGTGDSSGVLADRSVSGQTNDDIDAAIRFLVDQGAERVAIAATCWGGLVGLSAATRHEVVTAACLVSPPLRLIETGAKADTKGNAGNTTLTVATRQLFTSRTIKLLWKDETYRTWLLKRGRRRAAKVVAKARGRRPGSVGAKAAGRTNPQASGNLLTPLLQRKMPIHVLVGENEPTHRDLTEPGKLPALEAAASIMDVTATPVSVHGLASLEAQALVIDTVHTWLLRDLVANDVVTSRP